MKKNYTFYIDNILVDKMKDIVKENKIIYRSLNHFIEISLKDKIDLINQSKN